MGGGMGKTVGGQRKGKEGEPKTKQLSGWTKIIRIIFCQSGSMSKQTG
jgi:hypothetical protein